MKKALFIFILICAVGLSEIHISSFQTVGDNYEPKTIFTNGEIIWNEVIITNDEEISYPKLKINAYVNSIYRYDYVRTTSCEEVIIEEGINPGESKTIYFPCYPKDDLAKLEDYRSYVRLYVYEGGSFKYKDQECAIWTYDPDQPWTGAVSTSTQMNETNDKNNRFPLGHKFIVNFSVENFNPTEDLVVNITMYSWTGYPITCDPIGEVTLIANSNNYFDTECTVVKVVDYAYVNPRVHFGEKYIHAETGITQWWNYFVYIETGAVCGNHVIETGENCDPPDWGGKSCEYFGYDGGTLRCHNCKGISMEDCFMDLVRTAVEFIHTDSVSYLPEETVNILGQVKNTGNVDIPANSYMTIKFEDLNTNQVLYSHDHVFTQTFEPGDVISEWFSFENGEFPLYYFKVSAAVYFENGTAIPNPGSNVYSPATAGELSCTNTSTNGLLHLECTGTGTGRQLLKVPKHGGIFISFTTTPVKALYFWESGNDILIIDEPAGTVYFITLGFEVGVAPGLSPILAVVVMVLVSALVWERYVK